MDKEIKKRYLVLGNGEVFEGRAFGADCDTVGELVFTTGMCGYIETLTDPSYYGQIVLQTFPMIGNYGMIPADEEGEPALRGYVVREWCEQPSNFRCEGTVDEFLRRHGIPGICGIDTRRVTEIIRESGVMNAAICSAPPASNADILGYTIKDAVAAVSCREPHTLPAEGGEKYRVALIDYGAKRNIARELCRRGCTVTVYPHTVCAEEILGGGYDGVMLSNGPGDPSENTREIAVIGELFGRLHIPYGSRVEATISNGKQTLYKNIIVFVRSFAEVNVGEPLLYVNSLDCLAVAINQGSFARAYNIGTGLQWHISLRKAPRVVYD